MSDDDSDVIIVTGTRNRKKSALGKSGRKRLRTLDDSSDDDEDELFGDDDDEEIVKFSSKALKEALAQIKGCLAPSISYEESKMKSWAAVEKILVEKKATIGDLPNLVNVISTSKSLSLEFKCVVATVASQTCRVYEQAGQPKECNELFRKQDKNDKDKSNHLANFVSNRWLQESTKALGASPTKVDETDNMHIQVLKAGLNFVQSAFTVNAKVLKNLKEKQNIDWVALVKQIRRLSRDIVSLRHAAEAAMKHLVPMVPSETEQPSSGGTAKLVETKQATTDRGTQPSGKSKLQEKIDAKRKERINNLHKTARNLSRTSSTTASSLAAPRRSTWGAPSTNNDPSPAAAPRPTWGVPSTSSTNNDPSPAAAPRPTWGVPSTSSTNNDPSPAAAPRPTWGAPSTSSTNNDPSPAAAPRPTWGAPSTSSTNNDPSPAAAPHPTWGAPSSSANNDPTPAAAPRQTWGWGAPSTSSTNNDPSPAAAPRPTWGAPSSSANNDPTPAAAPRQTWGWGAPSSSTNNAPPAATGTWGTAAATTKPLAWGTSSPKDNNKSTWNPKWDQSARTQPSSDVASRERSYAASNRSSSYDGGRSLPPQAPELSSYNNQGSANRGAGSWNENGATERNESSWNGPSSTSSHDGGVARGTNSSNRDPTFDNQRYSAYSNAADQNGYHANNRPRNDRNVVPRNDNPPPAGRGRGRGLDMTKPAWMTHDNDGPAGNDRNVVPRNDNPPPAGRGRGRGLDMTKPAWMTHDNDGPAGNDRNVVPRNDNPPPAGRGRGRGLDMTKPAWMTHGNDGPAGMNRDPDMGDRV